MNVCTECGTEWRSELAAAECAEQDRLEDLNTRQFFAGYQNRANR